MGILLGHASQKRRLGLQAKVVLVLVGVMLPTFLIVTLAEHQLTRPLLEDEVLQATLNQLQSLGDYIVDHRLYPRSRQQGDPDAGRELRDALIEERLQQVLYHQPSIVRLDVFLRTSQNGIRLAASNFEENPDAQYDAATFGARTESQRELDDSGNAFWNVHFPLFIPPVISDERLREKPGEKSGERYGDKASDRNKAPALSARPAAPIGFLRARISLQLVAKVASTFWKITATAAVFSVVALVALLSFFLRRTIENDRKLQEVERFNLALSEQLHEAQRKLVISEKLAVMGQLTASFAHEIGTPLNSVHGHLQLLESDLRTQPEAGSPSDKHPGTQEWLRRLEIIQSQIQRIAGIVKSFLQSTAQPASAFAWVDVHPLLERCLSLVEPRVRGLGIAVEKKFDGALPQVQVVPAELEQVLLNVLNNALDSLSSKEEIQPQQKVDSARSKSAYRIKISSERFLRQSHPWMRLLIEDTGVGISKRDLAEVTKPFFTTKPPGSGTGLGLTISKELVTKNRGLLSLESKEGAWARVTIELPLEGHPS